MLDKIGFISEVQYLCLQTAPDACCVRGTLGEAAEILQDVMDERQESCVCQ